MGSGATYKEKGGRGWGEGKERGEGNDLVPPVSGGKRRDYQNCSVLYRVLKVVHSHKHT